MITLDFSGRVALITGASQGLGEATARRLHTAGASVAINYFPDPAGENQKRADAVVASLGERAIALPADIRERKQVDECVAGVLQEFGRLDILVNNAAVIRDRTLQKMTEDDWNMVIDTNLTGVFNMCKAVFDHLAIGGRIVNLTSISGAIGFFGQANYSTAKGGLMSFTKVLSKELAYRKITVNAVAPGVILTEMGASIPENIRAEMIKQIPLRCFGEPDDIANAILFLCSDLAKYMTGQTLHVNGGWWA